MSQQFTMYRLLDIISQKEGICEICGRPGTGKTTLMLQIVDKVSKRKDGTAIIFSMAEGETKISQMMKHLNVACDRVIIYDTPHPTAKYIEEKIEEAENISILCIDYLQLLESSVAEKLTGISKKYGLPVLVIRINRRTEPMTKIYWNGEPAHIFMEWDEKETKFQFEKDTGGMAYETTTHIL